MTKQIAHAQNQIFELKNRDIKTLKWDTYMQCGRNIFSYASNVECVHDIGHGHIVHCIGFI